MDDDDYVPSHLRKPPPVDGTVFAAINNNITAIFAHIYLDQYYRCGFKDQIAIMKAIELCPNLHIRNQLWRKVAGWIFGLSAAKAWIRWRELKTDLTKHGWVRLSLGYGPRWLGFLLDRQLTGMHVIDHYHLTPSIRWSGAIKLHEKFGWRQVPFYAGRLLCRWSLATRASVSTQYVFRKPAFDPRERRLYTTLLPHNGTATAGPANGALQPGHGQHKKRHHERDVRARISGPCRVLLNW